MSAGRYVALLRGINVGGNNLIPMASLRDAFEAEGYGAIRTYIASGNVLFESDGKRGPLEVALEGMLVRRFGVESAVVVRTQQQMRNIVHRAPEGFGAEPALYHSDVVFLKAPLTADRAMRVVEVREGVDQVWPGTGVLYFARLSARRSQSRMSSIVGTPEYKLMTIRSWSTTTRLLTLMGER
jgi:uncharacterized protein (DUF1697 family)